MRQRFLSALTLAFLVAPVASAHAADTARTMYTRALDQERTVRDESNDATVQDVRRLVRLYEQIVRRYPSSGYCDNALWQAANLSILAFDRFGEEADRKTAQRLLDALTREYSSSSLGRQARQALLELKEDAHNAVPAVPSPSTAAEPPPALTPAKATAADAQPSAAPGEPAFLSEIHRTSLPDGVRITLDLGSEVAFHQEEIGQPRRIFFDLKNVRSAPGLQDATLKYDDDVLREIRLGRHPQNTVRVVLNLEGVGAYTVYSLYNPYRLVIDATRASGVRPAISAVPLVASLPAPSPARTEPSAPRAESKPPTAVSTSGPATPSTVKRVRDDDDDVEEPRLRRSLSGARRRPPSFRQRRLRPTRTATSRCPVSSA